LGAFRIAVLAGFDQSFRSTQCRGFNEHDDLLFWRGVKVIAGHDRRDSTAGPPLRQNKISDAQLLDSRTALLLFCMIQFEDGRVRELFENELLKILEPKFQSGGADDRVA
jgi:hypothetical protein